MASLSGVAMGLFKGRFTLIPFIFFCLACAHHLWIPLTLNLSVPLTLDGFAEKAFTFCIMAEGYILASFCGLTATEKLHHISTLRQKVLATYLNYRDYVIIPGSPCSDFIWAWLHAICLTITRHYLICAVTGKSFIYAADARSPIIAWFIWFFCITFYFNLADGFVESSDSLIEHHFAPRNLQESLESSGDVINALVTAYQQKSGRTRHPFL